MRSVRAVWWCLLAPGLLAGGEHVVTDFVDGVVQMLEGFGDLLPGSVMRQGGGRFWLPGNRPGVDRQPGSRVLEVTVEHDR